MKRTSRHFVQYEHPRRQPWEDVVCVQEFSGGERGGSIMTAAASASPTAANALKGRQGVHALVRTLLVHVMVHHIDLELRPEVFDSINLYTSRCSR